MADPYDPPRTDEGEIYAEDHAVFLVHSRPSNVIPPSLLGPLLTTGVWPAERVLAHIERLQVPSDRGDAVVAVAPFLPAEALRLTRTVTWDRSRADALERLGPHLPEELLDEAWRIAADVPDPTWRALALTSLAPFLPGDASSDVLAAARAIAPATSLTRLLPGLPPDLRAAMLQDAFPTREIENWRWRDMPLEVVAGRYDDVPMDVRTALLERLGGVLPPSLLERAWSEACGVSHPHTRAAAMAGVAPYLPEDRRTAALREARAAIRSMPPNSGRVLARLAGHLPSGQQEQAYREAIATAGEERYLRDRASALTELVPLLPGDLRAVAARKALAEVVKVPRPGWRAFDVCRLGPYLPADLLPTALGTILTVEREQWRSEGLAFIAEHLPPDLLEQATRDANALTDPYWQAFAISRIVPHLPEHRRSTTLAALPLLDGKP